MDYRNIVLLSLAKIREVEKQELVQTFPKGGSEWDEWLKVVLHNRIAPIIYLNISKLGVDLPEEVAKQLNEKYQDVKSANESRFQISEKLFVEFENRNISCLILKGNAIAQEIYGDLGYKQMNDIDILVKSKDLRSIEEIYRVLGLISAAQIQGSLESVERHSYHWPPFAYRNLKCVIGTHWHIAQKKWRRQVSEEELWKDTVPFKFGNLTGLRLSDQKFLLHLCLHLAEHKLGIRELADVFNFLRYLDEKNKSPTAFAEEFLRLVGGTLSAERVYRALAFSECLMPTNVGSEILTVLRGEVPLKIQNNLGRPLNLKSISLLRTNHLSKIERAYALFTLTEKPLEKAAWLAVMWKNLLWPNLDDALRLNKVVDPRWYSKVTSRLLAPMRVSQAFAHDLGWPIYLISIAHHHYVLLKSISKGLWSRRKSLQDIALELGMERDQLLRLGGLE